ncbi:imidazole glycerol phosphate synthase subunit HisH [Candidatus Carsonella ruddii]|uniref:Imidazole glycerol phosphate synthase, glutamine amidotransferase subunit n=1 Tax=Candidatus Carsonella ruddii CE isolate Thao2000 TaxID=1202536 RepID=J7GZW1_CARRU|nr:imidazole glycerol phosphate synthase subunit HisH [Candidatus Carsonella ruddii]AFP83545.1 imidazole glycerol phosphate synthase, glutamine amidotransferase subunit [Candidatus Carsonella ruddii CE isolate Thao2000]
MNILIINYGSSNINSIYNSIKKIKNVNVYVNDFKNDKIDKVIFPGQSHIKTSIKFIKKNYEFYEKIKNKYTLGICIGYHIFFKNSEENIKINSLNYINKNIKLLSNKCCNKSILPNIGWKPIYIIKNHKIFKNIPLYFNQYFMNSYSYYYNKDKFSFGISKINTLLYNSIIIKNNKILFQFHPEKSGNLGLKLINNFINL